MFDGVRYRKPRGLKAIKTLHAAHKSSPDTRPWTQAQVTVQDVDFLLARIEDLKIRARKGA